MTPTSPTTNPRKARCIDCATPIAPRSGIVAGFGRYVCTTCGEIRKAQEAAWSYRRAITGRVNNPSDRWMVNSMLSHLVLSIGINAPVVLQAVADRVCWMDEANYSSVCQIAAQETRALGLNVVVS